MQMHVWESTRASRNGAADRFSSATHRRASADETFV
jgi:hypothetical protein